MPFRGAGGGPAARHRVGQRPAWFEDGRVSEMELEDRVLVVGEGMRASGARATTGQSAGPGHAARGPERQPACSAGLGSREGDRGPDPASASGAAADARGNVQGSIDDAVLLGGQGGGPAPSPVHFAADQLTALDQGDAFLLEGNARAWQGRRLLQADRSPTARATSPSTRPGMSGRHPRAGGEGRRRSPGRGGRRGTVTGLRRGCEEGGVPWRGALSGRRTAAFGGRVRWWSSTLTARPSRWRRSGGSRSWTSPRVEPCAGSGRDASPQPAP